MSRGKGRGPKGEVESISFEGQVSARDGRPYVKVTCRLGDRPVFATQMAPSVATALGLRAVQASIEAERDAGTIAFLRQGPGMELEDAARFLQAMREHREQFDPAAGSLAPLADDDTTTEEDR